MKKRNIWTNRKRLAVIASCLLALAMLAAPARAADGLIISSNFVADEDRYTLDGLQVELATDLPGSKWVWGAGWHWGEPFVPATWESFPQNLASLAEEKTALGISIASAGSYTKPKLIHISANLAISGDNGGGLGFWPAMPARDDKAEPATHFTGLNLMLNGDLQLYADGVATGSAVHTAAINPGEFHTLSYDVNTTTGAISNVVFDLKPMTGLSSTAFKDSSTAFAGAFSGHGARLSMNNFTVSSIPEPK